MNILNIISKFTDKKWEYVSFTKCKKLVDNYTPIKYFDLPEEVKFVIRATTNEFYFRIYDGEVYLRLNLIEQEDDRFIKHVFILKIKD